MELKRSAIIFAFIAKHITFIMDVYMRFTYKILR